jgi:hypothetical protein
VTDDGGQQVRQTYFVPCHWIATLNLPPEEVFGDDSTLSTKTPEERLMDLEHPILLLDRPEQIR